MKLRPRSKMAKIVGKPRPEMVKKHRVRCESCDSLIEYQPEEVQRRDGIDYSGGPDGFERVKCPAEGCRGHGYIRRW
jgi:hypothetical protein